jgi:hypothetical protein
MVQGKRAYDDGLDAIDNGDEALFNDVKNEQLPGYALGATVSFASCGVLLATGITLVLLSLGKPERPSNIRAGVQLKYSSIRFSF